MLSNHRLQEHWQAFLPKNSSSPKASALPDPTGVVLRASDDDVALVIERAREDLVDVALEDLQRLAGVRRPDPACLVAVDGE